jgi:hypothetical protein
MRNPSRFSFLALPLLLPFLLLCVPAPAHAVGPSADLYLGYGRLGSNTFNAGIGGLNGWEAAGQVGWMPFVGVEADVAHYGLGAGASVPRTTTFLFGPRVTLGAAGIHVFAHGLVGGEHSANSGGPGHISNNALTIALGGGLDFRILPFFAWRFGADYIAAPTQSPPGASHDRFTTGLVFRF